MNSDEKLDLTILKVWLDHFDVKMKRPSSLYYCTAAAKKVEQARDLLKEALELMNESERQVSKGSTT